MHKVVLITGAGGGGSSNLIRDLRIVDKNIRIIGTNLDKYVLSKSNADVNYLLPPASNIDDYIAKLNKIINKEKVDLIIPNSDREVFAVSKFRDRIMARVFLPSHDSISKCQDKWLFYNAMQERNVNVAKTFEVECVDRLDDIIKKEFMGHEWLWVRLKTGSGSKGATRVQNCKQARFWIEYWRDVRGIKEDEFLISEFLPGRDLAVQSTWKNGELKLMKIAERLSYYGGDGRPSGMSSSPALARTVNEPIAIELCKKAAFCIEKEPNGNFNFDLKQNKNGDWCLTEINIGRFCMITPIFDLTGKHNMIDTYIKLAFDEAVDIVNPYDIEESMYLVRELDTEPLILSEADINARSFSV